jgi:FkbM family methyltransferase
MLSLKKLVRRILGRQESEWALRIKRDNDRVEKLLPKILTPSSSCIDIGSHNGMYLKYFQNLSPLGSHVAFEPLPAYFSILKKTFPGIDVYNVALSDFEGTAKFYNPIGAEAMSGLRKQHYPNAVNISEFDVPVKRLDQFIHSNRKISFIKIDVEGAELNVLMGSVEVIRRDKPVILFEFAQLHAQEYGTTPKEMFDFFSEMGYSIYRLDRELKYDRGNFDEIFNEAHRSGYNRTAETNFLAVYDK